MIAVAEDLQFPGGFMLGVPVLVLDVVAFYD